MQDKIFEALFLKHYKKLRQYCLYLTKNVADSEDLAQESCTRFFGKFHNEVVLSIPDEKVFYYLKGIAKNCFLEEIRKHNHSHNMDSLDEYHDKGIHPDKESFDSLNHRVDFNQICRAGSTVLSELEQKIVISFYIERCTQQEIAEKYSITVRSVKYKLEESIRKIQNGLKYPD